MAQSFPDDHKIDELVAKVAPGWKMLETDVYLVDVDWYNSKQVINIIDYINLLSW